MSEVGVPAPVALVTGASSGTGRDTAFALAEAGYDVALVGRRTEALDAAAARISELGRRALALPADVTDAGAVAVAITEFLAWSTPPASPARSATRLANMRSRISTR